MDEPVLLTTKKCSRDNNAGLKLILVVTTLLAMLVGWVMYFFMVAMTPVPVETSKTHQCTKEITEVSTITVCRFNDASAIHVEGVEVTITLED